MEAAQYLAWRFSPGHAKVFAVGQYGTVLVGGRKTDALRGPASIGIILNKPKLFECKPFLGQNMRDKDDALKSRYS